LYQIEQKCARHGRVYIYRIGEEIRKVNKYRSRYFDRKAWKPRKQDNRKGDEERREGLIKSSQILLCGY